MILSVRVAVTPSRFPFLASDAIWDPHGIVWIPALSDLTRVFPIHLGRECLQPRHVEMADNGALESGPSGVLGVRVCNTAVIDWICRDALHL